MVVCAGLARDEVDRHSPVAPNAFGVSAAKSNPAQATRLPLQWGAAQATGLPLQVTSQSNIGLAIRGDSLGDFDRELERRGCLKPRNPRFAPGPGTFNERYQLAFQRFLAVDCHFVAQNFPGLTAINFTRLFFVIEREIRVLLKNSDLAHTFRTDAARSHVCHATICETQPRISNIFAAAQHWHP